MHRSRTAFALGALLPLLLVSACSGDPEPKVAPSTSPSTSVSTSPSPTGPVEPVMPEAAKAHTAAGAEAFVAYYWEMVNYAQATGDVQSLRQLGEENCGACEGGIRFLERVFSGGGRISGGESTVTSADGLKVHAGPNVAYRVLVSVRNEKQFVDMPGTKRDKTYPGGNLRLQFILDLVPHSWTVGYWDKAPT